MIANPFTKVLINPINRMIRYLSLKPIWCLIPKYFLNCAKYKINTFQTLFEARFSYIFNASGI